LIDSLDSILMLYSYAGFPEHAWAIFEHGASAEDQESKLQGMPLEVEVPLSSRRADGQTTPPPPTRGNAHSSIHEISRADDAPIETSKLKSMDNGPFADVEAGPKVKSDLIAKRVARDLQVKRNTMSGLSIILTLMSILVAFR